VRELPEAIGRMVVVFDHLLQSADLSFDPP